MKNFFKTNKTLIEVVAIVLVFSIFIFIVLKFGGENEKIYYPSKVSSINISSKLSAVKKLNYL